VDASDPPSGRNLDVWVHRFDVVGYIGGIVLTTLTLMSSTKCNGRRRPVEAGRLRGASP
jgi:hypothetical protein